MRVSPLGIVIFSALLVGFGPSRCEPLCPLECETGYKVDLEGRPYCECRTDEPCFQVVSDPFYDPIRERCVRFPTPCDVPTGWEPCGTVCEVGDRVIRVGETTRAVDGCNVCTCLDDGGLACTRMACPVCEVDGQVYRVGERFPARDGCNLCTCGRDGRVACTEKACQCRPVPSDRELCERSGGWWDLLSCGHHRCGEFPACDAIIPGCDCGPGRSFADEMGCVADPSCDAVVCDLDADCPPGQRCEGSSVCPPDAVCIWEGRPGLCVPIAACCDPSAEPGVGDNPLCIEGASCCADGTWRCNEGDGSSTCEAAGNVCVL